jgi:hypothetical protein
MYSSFKTCLFSDSISLRTWHAKTACRSYVLQCFCSRKYEKTYIRISPNKSVVRVTESPISDTAYGNTSDHLELFHYVVQRNFDFPMLLDIPKAMVMEGGIRSKGSRPSIQCLMICGEHELGPPIH